MERVIVTVKCHSDDMERDLDVPSNLPAEALLGLLVEALQQYNQDETSTRTDCRILATPPGRVLSSHETLAQVGAWDGAILVVQPETNVPLTTPAPKVLVESPGPIEGYKPLNIHFADNDDLNSINTDSSSDNYVWKKLED